MVQPQLCKNRGSMDPVHERGSMDPVHIPVHGPGPRRGSMDQRSMFCTFPTGNIHVSLYYSITKVLDLNTIIKLARLHIRPLKLSSTRCFPFLRHQFVVAFNAIKRNPDNIDEKISSFIYNVSFHPSNNQEPLEM